MNRRSWLSLALATGLALPALTGCTNTLDDEYRAAVPAQSAVTIPVPGSAKAGTSSSGIGSTSQALLGATSEYYETTLAYSTVVNGSAIALLGIIKAVTAQPSTSSTATTRTWGPGAPGGLDPLAYRLVVTKVATGQFTFSLDARPKASTADADFLPILDGGITKGTAVDTGNGTMTLHFDNTRKLRPDACEVGAIEFVFDNTIASPTLDVSFSKFANDNATNPTCKTDMPTDATYHFSQDAAGNGNFVFAIAGDVDKHKDEMPAKLEELTIRSRWNASGAGRSDVRVSGGDVPGDLMSAGISMMDVTASQCWDTSFATVYETSAPAQLNIVPTDGDPTKCAFTSAQLP